MVAVVAGNGLGLLNTSLNILGESGVLMRCTCIFRRSTCICGNPPEARIDLHSVSYNPNPAGTCFKNRIVLSYDTAVTGNPLSMTLMGPTVLARVDKLTKIDVIDRSAACNADVALRTYTFKIPVAPIRAALNTSLRSIFAHCWFWQGFNGRWQE